jgi:hypothetical protein
VDEQPTDVRMLAQRRQQTRMPLVDLLARVSRRRSIR